MPKTIKHEKKLLHANSQLCGLRTALFYNMFVFFVKKSTIFLSFYGGLGPPLTLGWSETLIFRFRRNMVGF